MCDFGYKGDGESCVDIDECQLGHDNCQPHETCINSDGGFTCVEKRKRRSPGEACFDGTHKCDALNGLGYGLATCVPSDGLIGYYCVCQDGFEMTKEGCRDINECLNMKGGCDFNSHCINTFGSYFCQEDFFNSAHATLCDEFTCVPPAVCVYEMKAPNGTNDKPIFHSYSCYTPPEACDGVDCGQGFECQPYQNRLAKALEFYV